MMGSGRSATIWRRSCILATVLAMFLAAPASAHHQKPNDGPIRGVAVAAIAHGEMPIIARYRNQILDLAAARAVTDPTLRRLAGFVDLQFFACFWGLVPDSLADEQSPFNECSHAYLAGTWALLLHMTEMPGNHSAADELATHIGDDIANDPAAAMACSNSRESFDSAYVIWPDWRLAPKHAPTMLTFAAVAALFVTGLVIAGRRCVLGTA